jgi:SAM-dependent methyltransferase
VQVREAARHETFEAVVGDARDLQFEDDSFDVVLLFGPLYHPAAREDRQRALGEAARVVRPDGWVFAAAIPRLARLVQLSLAEVVPPPDGSDLVALLERGDPPAWGRFPGGHFHTAAEFEDELQRAGLIDVSVCAIEGPDGLAFEHLDEADDALHTAALQLVRAVGHLPDVREMTNHMMGIAQTPGER